jgi:hypothetical protein
METNMPQFRKKPVVIEAFQLTAETRASNLSWPEWACSAWNKDDGRDGGVADEGALSCEVGVPDGPLYVFTKEGRMQADIGDFIIQGVKGELYPCKPDIFASTYEAVA